MTSVPTNIQDEFSPNGEFAMGVDGELVNLFVPTAINDIRGGDSMNEFDQEFDNDDFFSAEGDYSNLFGKMRKNIKNRRKQRQVRKNIRVKSKANARQMRSKTKFEQAKAEQLSAKALAKGTKADEEMAKALQKGMNNEKEEKTGMSMGMKIGIGVGIAVVLGVVGFIIYKKTRK